MLSLYLFNLPFSSSVSFFFHPRLCPLVSSHPSSSSSRALFPLCLPVNNVTSLISISYHYPLSSFFPSLFTRFISALWSQSSRHSVAAYQSFALELKTICSISSGVVKTNGNWRERLCSLLAQYSSFLLVLPDQSVQLTQT